MQDIRLGDDGDAVITNFNLSLVEGADYLDQKIVTTLKLFTDEWFADITAGIDYYGSILIKNYDANLVESLLKSAILAIDGAKQFLFFDMNLSERSLSVNFVLKTIYGETQINEVIV